MSAVPARPYPTMITLELLTSLVVMVGVPLAGTLALRSQYQTKTIAERNTTWNSA
jgi:hypothetical protein